MNTRSQPCNGSLCSRSLSRGLTATRLVAAVVAVAVLIVVLMQLFPSREERLWDFVDATSDALMTGTEEEFAASFDPDVKYQASRLGTKGGLAEIRRDWKRYRAAGLPRPRIVSQKADYRVNSALIPAISQRFGRSHQGFRRS